MKKKALFLPFPVKSHLIASFKLARLVQGVGYEVLYGVPPNELREYVELQGFVVVPLRSFPYALGYEAALVEEDRSRNLSSHNTLYRMDDVIYKMRKSEIDDVVKLNRFEVIFIDRKLCTDFLVLYTYFKEGLLKLIFFQTFFDTSARSGSPPLNSGLIPRNGMSIRRVWLILKGLKEVKRLKEKIVFWGCDDRSMLYKKVRELMIPDIFGVDKRECFQLKFRGIPEIILAPKELEFGHRNGYEFKQYLGLMVDAERREIFSNDFYMLLDRIRQERSAGVRLIYCSMGSIYSPFYRKFLPFLRKLIACVCEDRCSILVLSADDRLKEALGDLPPKVYALDRIPQMCLLAETDLFVTAGGLNSIKESVYFGVPMLVFPWSSKWDQKGNAARIVYHGIGLRGDMQRDGKDAIKWKLDELIRNDRYRKTLQAIRKGLLTVTDEEISKSVADVITRSSYKVLGGTYS